jgi:hypothetical protein
MSFTGFSGLLIAHGFSDVFYHIKDYKQQLQQQAIQL